jgi:hypothetical protein
MASLLIVIVEGAVGFGLDIPSGPFKNESIEVPFAKSASG